MLSQQTKERMRKDKRKATAREPDGVKDIEEFTKHNKSNSKLTGFRTT